MDMVALKAVREKERSERERLAAAFMVRGCRAERMPGAVHYL